MRLTLSVGSLLLLLAGAAFANVPKITSVTPGSGAIGSTVTISGSSFGPNPSDNIVYFGAVRANVLSATPTTLTVTVPLGASYSSVSVTTGNLVGFSPTPFDVTFPSSGLIDSTSFADRVTYGVGVFPAAGFHIVDFDGDGKPDVSNSNGGSSTITVFRNASTAGAITSGSLTDAIQLSTGNQPFDFNVADLDGDGRLDILTLDRASNSGHFISLFLNTSSSGALSFQPRFDLTTPTNPFSIALNDFDGDGMVDVAIACYGTDSIAMFHNQSSVGNLSFDPPVYLFACAGLTGIASGDLNGDGRPELVVVNGSCSSVSLLKNSSSQGLISFLPKVDVMVPGIPNTVAIGDIDGDGKLDLLVSNYMNNYVTGLLNHSTGGTFTPSTFSTEGNFPVGTVPRTIAIGDFDGDGRPDVLVGNHDSNNASILHNTSSVGSISFSAKLDIPTGKVPLGVDIGDVDGDGRPDWGVAENEDGTISLYRNLLGDTFLIDATAGLHGTITPAGSVNVFRGASQTFAITPDAGYHVQDVHVDTGSVGTPTNYTFSNVLSAHTISATFAADTFSVVSSAVGHGSISPAGLSNVIAGGSLSFTLLPDTGYHVDSLFVDGVVVPNALTYEFSNVTANHSITVKFAVNVYTIASSAIGNGSISPDGSTSVTYGGSQSYTITPNTGYHLDSLIVDGSHVANTSTYEFTNVSGSHSISARFAINVYTISSSVIGNGSITPNGSTNVNYGGSQSYTVTPNTGYHLDSLFVDGSQVANASSYDFTNVTSDRAITAKFAIDEYTINSSAIGNGSISPNGITNVNYGGSQSYTITPNTGYHLDSLFVDGSHVVNASTYDFTNVTSNRTITAKFAINVYTIVSSVVGNGTISPSGSTNVNYGGSQSYAITAATGYHLDSLYVDGSHVVNASTYDFTNVTSNRTITAKFAINVYTIASSAIENGSISPSGSTNVNYGGSQSYTITAATGYHLDSLFVDGSHVANASTYDFTNVTANRTITAKFAINTYTINAAAVGNGTISPSGSTNVNYGGSQSYAITAATGYHLDSLYVDGSHVVNASTYDFTNVTSNRTITAKFAINVYTIASSAIGNGSISPSGSTNVNYGGSQSYTITAATGYHLDSLFVDGSHVTNASTYDFTNVTSNRTITAKFAINTYTINAAAIGNGTISPNGTTNVNYGGSQSYTITPNTGYHLDSLFVDGSHVANASTYDFTNVTTNSTITAKFAINVYTINSSTIGNGSISPDGITNVNFGGSQSYTITAATGYHLDSLFVDGSHVTNASTYDFTNVTSNRTITAKFAINVYTIASSTIGNGSISPSGSTDVNYGGSQSYTITPNTGYHLDSLFVDGSHVANAPTYDFTNVTANRTITARFAINTYTINAAAVGNGTISPSGSTNVNFGGSQSYTITPNTGYHLDSLFVDGSHVANAPTYDFTNVTANRTITAKFAINVFTIASSVIGNGTISPSGNTNVNYGGSQSYTITAAIGYHLDSLFVDGLHVANASTYDFTNVNTNRSITAKFAINVYTINSSAVGNGSISPNGITNVNYGGSQSYTITPNSGHHLDSLFVDGSHVPNVSTYDFTNVTSNRTITAKFAINTYTINAAAVGNGTVSPSGSTNVNYGGSQSYTITAAIGYHLDSLFVDGLHVANASTYDFTNVTSNRTITAKFAINTYTINAAAVGNGTISPNGITNVNYGGSQSYTISAATGYHLDSLFVDGTRVANASTYDFTNVTSNRTITAKFAIDAYTITSSAIGNGTISPSGSTNVNYGGSQSYTITAAIGYHLDSLFVDGLHVANASTYDFTNVTSNRTITAKFAINTYTINAAAVGNGTISPNGITNVNYGGSQSYTISAATGYHLDSLFVDGTRVANASTYDFTNVTSNRTITAKFAIDAYTITSSAIGNGTISPSGSTNVNYGGSQSYTITAAIGYHLDSLFVDGLHVANASTYDFTNVTSNRTITAKFAINTYTINAAAVGNGTISPNGITNVNYGGSQSYTISAATGYHLDSLFVDGTRVANASTYDFTNVTSNRTITAKFAIDAYTITSSAIGNGTISPTGSTNVNFGGSQSYTIAPNTGYHLDSLFVDGAHVANASTYDFTNVTSNRTITAKFAINVYTINSSTVGGGTISPNGSTNVSHGGSQSYTISPNTGYHLDSLFVDGSHLANVLTYDFTNVTSNRTITAKFAINTYTISSSTEGYGSITPDGVTNVNYGGSQSYTITPNPGYHLDSLFVDGSQIANASMYEFTNITTDHSISAVFAYTCLPASIKPDAIADGEKGHAYLQTFTEEGGAGLQSFGITAGAVPPGMTFSSSGVLSGIPDSAGLFHFMLEAVDSQGCSTSREYALSIGVIARFAVSETTLTFGDVIVGIAKQDTIVVSNPGSGDLNVHAALDQTSPFNVVPDSTVIPPGGEQKFVVGFLPTTAGQVTGSLSLYHNAAGGIATVSLSGTGLAPQFTVNSHELDFSYVLLGTTRRDSLIISNTGTSQLDVTGASSDDSAFVITPGSASIAPGAHATFFIDFTPQAIGHKFADVLFTHNAGAPASILLDGTGDVLTTVLTTHPQRWAMVSNPVITGEDSVRELFPTGGLAYAFAYDNPGGYSHAQRLANGRGYWEKFSTAGVDTMHGLQILNDTIQLQTGWNMIGSMSVPVTASAFATIPSGILASKFFGFNSGYEQVDTILPGTAYWVKSAEPGVLILRSNGAIPKVIPYGPALNLNALRISDAAGNLQNLKYTFDPVTADVLSKFELPPPPPEGMLYAKFDNGKSLVGGNDSRKDFAIILSTVNYPVTIQWSIGEGATESAYLRSDGRIVRLTGTGSVTVADENSKVELSFGKPDDAIPAAYALRQNYPNPFNPSTVIEYDLPEDAHVSLKVYDILGSEVAALIDGNEVAGKKSVRFDGAKLSSGVYFYRLSAGNYTETKRLMIVK